MTKHNKKRNVGLIYELLLNHISNCLIENDMRSLNVATKIIEKRFAKGTELYREFRLFNALAKMTASDTHIVASILTEAKAAARNCDSDKLDKEKSALIRDINYKINNTKFYYQNIKNYKDLATIQIMINEWRKGADCNIQKLIEYEKKVGENLLKDKPSIDLDSEKNRLDMTDSNKLVLKIMTEKMNNKYNDKLSPIERDIIKRYVIYSNDGNKKQLIEFFKKKKHKTIKLLENFEDTEDNKILIKKVDSVRSRIENLNVNNINDQAVIQLLTLTKLIREIKNSGDKNG